ncbi:MAG TPA: AMP-binding protein [Polyangia bacterium]|nr:AMP-binding protein [Polyangia bacterium]
MTHPLLDAPPLDIAQTFAGRRLLFIGATGFVGKVALSLLLRNYPGLGKVFVLVRPGAGSSAEERFFRKIVGSPVFDPIREVWGEGTEAFLREKVVPLPGDVSRPDVNFGPAEFETLGRLDAVVNSAGLVSFNPSLESALRINTLGVKNVLDVCRRTGAGLVHISTCFVAGNRDGEIWEDEPVGGFFPRQGELRDDDFSVEAEIADCQRLIEQVRARADDRAHVSEFRDKGAARLRDEGRDPDDERTLRIAVQRERKRWVNEELVALGMERAKHWGWPNTYTYTKSLGEQLCAQALTGPDAVRSCIVRPSIVESSVRYPFPGWNEGFNTTAPLAMLSLMGHRNVPAGDKVILDLIPVDQVCAGLVAATAATIQGTNAFVYQLASGDMNPLYQRRAIELVGHYKRIYYQRRIKEGEGNRFLNELNARLEAIPVTRERFERTSSPLWKAATDGLIRAIDDLTPRWGAPRLSALADRAKEKLQNFSDLSGQTIELIELFMPFIYERKYVYRCDNTRAMFARLPPQDRAALRWDPEAINWRTYWLDVHLPGLEKWVFPELEEEFKAKPKSVYTYKDLIELFDATTKHHRNRTAMRLLPPSGEPGQAQEPQRYTYGDLQELAGRVAEGLGRHGVQPGDKVLLVSENRPEWGITYFGILKRGAAAVPVDHQATREEVVNLVRWSHARVLVVSERQAERLGLHGALTMEDRGARGGAASGEVAGAQAPSAPAVPVLGFEELLAAPHVLPNISIAPAQATWSLVHQPKGDDLASLIFTSGTTGRPKGVMLSHRNFTSLLSKLAGVFELDRHDGMLSVLPLHHTFEFTAGLLMPLMRGAQITYLDEVNADALQAAFDEVTVSGMIGVPALWQLLHRKITKTLADRGSLWLRVFEAVVELHRRLRDSAPVQLNLGKLLFWPVHSRFGGRLRLLISGGSALAPETMKAFRGLGFDLFEGYGLTESAPVLTVSRPGRKVIPGSVGEPLPGIEVRIDSPDATGVGEVIASGPNVMMGYYEDPDATAATLRDGWLHTGDLGRFDEDKRLYIVGRQKDVIIAANGENVYPDELEELYRDSPYVKELSIVGLPDEHGGGELVACLAVPEYEQREDRKDLGREEIRERLREHVGDVSAKLPHYKRVKVLHLTDLELPKTATRKVKRKVVVEELRKLERLRQKGQEARAAGKAGAAGASGTDVGDWLQEVLAAVSGKPLERVQSAARLDELGFDSLMYTELGVALEAAGVAVPEGVDLTGVASLADFQRMVGSWGRRKEKDKDKVRAKEHGGRRGKEARREGEAEEIRIPRGLVTVGNAALDFGQRMTYERLFETRVTGRAHIPQDRSFLVVANHASHLDMGLVKHALGDWGQNLVALAAKDYFFEDPVRRAYFENFTNLVPMDRYGSLRESLRLASEVLREGYVLLIFPEGTRSVSGVMTDFKPSVGYLALQNRVGILPMYLEGTHGALPKGSVLPKQRKLGVHIGPFISYERLLEIVAPHPRGEHNRAAAHYVEAVVRSLAPQGSVNYRPLVRETERRVGVVSERPAGPTAAGGGAHGHGGAHGRILVEDVSQAPPAGVAEVAEAAAGGDLRPTGGLGEALHTAEERK